MKNKLDELLTNQNFILESIDNMNQRLGAMEEKFDDKTLQIVKP